MNDTDITHMRHALALGARGLGRTWPNPAVGCVLVKDGHITGRGWTQDGGAPHAETVALALAGPNAKGATAYVTLEPCAHQGRTPPCTSALIDARVARVVIAADDPDPRVNGQGVELLRAAGIAVETGVLADVARDQHIGFMTKTTLGRPMVTLKLAASLDGRIATATGESQWITGPDARRQVHAMRTNHDAVMVGGGTARKDDPSLNVRDLGVTQQPVRIVWSRNLDLPLQGKLAATAKDQPLWIIHGEHADSAMTDAWAGLGARLFPVALASRQIDPKLALAALGDAGLTRIFCEGGGQLAASLLASDLVDELVTFTAGLAIGADGLAMLGSMGITRLQAAKRYELREMKQLGSDAMLSWRKRQAD